MLRRLHLLACCAAISACGRDNRDADPYAARYTTEKAPYVRTATRVIATTTPLDSATDPLFTDAQATSGATVYGKTCGRCHASTQWQGGTFAAVWRDRRVSDFYDLVFATMPQDAPGSLTQEEYVNVTAYVMQLAGFKGGEVALRADTAVTRHERIHIDVVDTSKTGDTTSKKAPPVPKQGRRA